MERRRLAAAVLGCVGAVALGAGCGTPAASAPTGTASGTVATPTTSRTRTTCTPTGANAPDKAVTGYYTALGAHDVRAVCRYLAPEYLAESDRYADPSAFDAGVARWDGSGRGSRWLAKPLTFMNESGRAVGAIARYHKLPVDAIAAVYDDLTIELGRPKISVTGSAGGHNGVASLLEHLGDGFVRYRIGIGPKEPPEMDLKDFVLSKFTPAQLATIEQKLDSYVQGLELLLDRGADQAMNQLNRKDSS